MGLILKISLAGIISLSVVGVFLVACIIILFAVLPFSSWWKALISGANIPMEKLIAMKARKDDLNSVVIAFITAKRAGLNLDIEDLETHVLAGGNIDSVVKSMISAKLAGIELSLSLAMALDLSGKDSYKIIKDCISPRVVDTPFVTAVAKDGVELTTKASITIKGNIKRVVGGADENTITLRVAEALSSVIGSATTHDVVMENPDVISDAIMKKGLDRETAYEIISIDMYDIKAGKNIALEQQLAQADLERKTMENRLEARRLEALALEQENKAKVQENKAKQVEIETEIPKALAKALEEGKISPVEYYDIQNLQADTNLRNILSGKASKDTDLDDDKNKIKRNPFGFN